MDREEALRYVEGCLYDYLPSEDSDKVEEIMKLLRPCKDAIDREKAVVQPSNKNIFDKIKAEFISKYPRNYMGELEFNGSFCVFSLNEILKTIDKYQTMEE